MLRRIFLTGAAAFALAACGTSMKPTPAHTPAEMAKTGDIVDVAIGAGSFNTLVAAVKAAGLVDTLKGPGPFTVFAPTDAAFAALPAGTVDSLLLPENKAKLTQILTYHVVPGTFPASSLVGRTVNVATVAGLTVLVNGIGGVRVNNANVVTPDVQASNGIIHVIDAVLLP